MENHRICKICNRRFPNGKAMGGHMRSHLAKLPIPPKPILKTTCNSSELTPSTQSPSSSSSLNLISRKNPKRFYRSLNRELSQDSAAHDKESDTESQPKNLTRRRSKRRRKEVVKVAEQVSSTMSDILTEEDVALCLIMLSKDKWAEKRIQKEADDELDDEEEEEPVEEEDEEEEDNELLCRSRTRTGRNQSNRFKCETCKKVFRSYQALGGHRASHKKIIIKAQIFEGEFSKDCNAGTTGTINYVIEHKTFECPYCCKVFDSGQALGGHKKVHFSNFSDTRNNNIASTKFNDNLVIDLNLPAPEEDEEVSTVSDY
ncbi:hypothetical protein FNV43_RR24266 [Rhamnella rubrinervis]|uniref:C2H2-type domain-containing protein n=1 Tax=Rhamnella rubrinervis TaxID=2594499 RepID=A0A8K0GNY1_9ROSA|nr:hypothetical protein FNV43_RR24266 [Rhamnella rubrinervis]